MNKSTISNLKFNLSQDSIGIGIDNGSSSIKVVEEGEEFAIAIASLSKGNYVPAKKSYPPFKKTFWEEPKYNPSLSQTSQEYEFPAHIKEESSHWHQHGHIWDTEKRFIQPKPKNEIGPIKSEEYPHYFENGQKYFGRKREILPLLRAKVYTRPLDRCDENIVKMNRAPSNIGPGSYDIGDYWQPKSYSSVGPNTKPSSFMESKSKRDLNEFYGIHEPSSSEPSPGNVKEIHQAKTRTLLPTTHNALINVPSKDITSFGVTTRESTTPKSPYQKQKGIKTENSGTGSRPHTSGTKFGKSTNNANQNGVPSDVHFIRVSQPSGPVIIPVSNYNENNDSIDTISNDISHNEVIETWSRPQSKCERSQLYIEAIPIQSFASSSFVDNNSSKPLEVHSVRDRIEYPPKVIISPKNRAHSASPHSPANKQSTRSNNNTPIHMTKDDSTPNISPSSPIVKSPPYSAPNFSTNNNNNNNRSKNKFDYNDKKQSSNNSHNINHHNNSIPIYTSPKVSKRSLSYDHLQKEKRFQINNTTNLINHSFSSPVRTLSTDSSSPKVSLFLSEKVVVNVPNRDMNDSRATTGSKTRTGSNSARSIGRYDESQYNKMTNKSSEILQQLENNYE